jgi:hypothetical protein
LRRMKSPVLQRRASLIHVGKPSGSSTNKLVSEQIWRGVFRVNVQSPLQADSLKTRAGLDVRASRHRKCPSSCRASHACDLATDSWQADKNDLVRIDSRIDPT